VVERRSAGRAHEKRTDTKGIRPRQIAIIGLRHPDRGAVSAQGDARGRLDADIVLLGGSVPFACPLSMRYF
jgi:hypothetical protein